jgi:ribosomal protein L11 methyltransferase
MSEPSSGKVWKSVLILCEPGFEDLVSGLVFDAGFSGIEERVISGRTHLIAYFSASTGNDPISTLETLIEIASIESDIPFARILSSETVPDTDWETIWREGIREVETGERLVVRPSWVEYGNRSGRIEIIIDPKMAFGTGNHGTTRLCLEALERFDPAGKTVLDAGCGSGVLSIAAAKLGAARVEGFDNDPFSVENARENILLNGVSDRVAAEIGDVAAFRTEPVDIVLANLISGVLVASLPVFQGFVRNGGITVFSGLLDEEEGMFRGHLESAGFRVLEVTRREEWIAVIADIPCPHSPDIGA